MADGPPVVESILHVFCARYRRMVEQQELRAQECISVWGFGHSRRALVAQGSAKLVSLVQGMQPVGDGQARSSLMAALIDQADAKGRCVEVVPLTLGNQV